VAAIPLTGPRDSPIDFVRTMRQTLDRYALRTFLYGGRDESDHAQWRREQAAPAAEMLAEWAPAQTRRVDANICSQ
jgi:hypothetical protein